MKHRTNISRRAARGFTLVELLAAVSIAGVLSSIAWPSFEGSLQRARRADATLSMAQLQIVQERWYANRGRYGNLAELRLPERSSAGHYRLEVVAADEQAYVAHALASGAQARAMSLRQCGRSATPRRRSGYRRSTARCSRVRRLISRHFFKYQFALRKRAIFRQFILVFGVTAANGAHQQVYHRAAPDQTWL